MLLLEPVLVLLLLFARPLLNILRTVNSRLFHIFWAKQAKQEVEDGWWLGGERGGGGGGGGETTTQEPFSILSSTGEEVI